MRKEKQVKAYTRKTKSGKVVQVKGYKAGYDSTEEMLKAMAKKKGAGNELETLKKKSKEPDKVSEDSPYGFSADDYKAWYNWDQDADPKNTSALKVEKSLKKIMGAKGYKRYFDEMSEMYNYAGYKRHFTDLHKGLTSPDLAKKVEKNSEWLLSHYKKEGDTKHQKRIEKGLEHFRKGDLQKASNILGEYEVGIKNAFKYMKLQQNLQTPSQKIEKSYGNKDKVLKAGDKKSEKIEKVEPKTKKLTAKDYQSMSDEELWKHHDNYRYKTNSSLSRSEQYHKKAISEEVTRRREAKEKAEEKSARKAIGGLVSGSTWEYNSSDGSFRTSHSTAWGRPDSSRVEKLIQKAKDAGWKKADHSSSMQPDDKGYRSTERYVSPDGKHELTYHYSAGDFSRNNHHVTIRRTKSEEAPIIEKKR